MLPAPQALKALLIHCQEHWLKQPRDKQKLKICVPVAVNQLPLSECNEPKGRTKNNGWEAFGLEDFARAPERTGTQGWSLSHIRAWPCMAGNRGGAGGAEGHQQSGGPWCTAWMPNVRPGRCSSLPLVDGSQSGFTQ